MRTMRGRRRIKALYKEEKGMRRRRLEEERREKERKEDMKSPSCNYHRQCTFTHYS